MAKRVKPAPMDVELKQRLVKLSNDNGILQRSMDDINELLKGSAVLNYKGIIKNFEEIQSKMEKVVSQMDHWERWRQIQIAKKGTFTFKTANLLTQVMVFIGAVGTLTAITYTIIQIVEKVKLLN